MAKKLTLNSALKNQLDNISVPFEICICKFKFKNIKGDPVKLGISSIGEVLLFGRQYRIENLNYFFGHWVLLFTLHWIIPEQILLYPSPPPTLRSVQCNFFKASDNDLIFSCPQKA